MFFPPVNFIYFVNSHYFFPLLFYFNILSRLIFLSHHNEFSSVFKKKHQTSFFLDNQLHVPALKQVTENSVPFTCISIHAGAVKSHFLAPIYCSLMHSPAEHVALFGYEITQRTYVQALVYCYSPVLSVAAFQGNFSFKVHIPYFYRNHFTFGVFKAYFCLFQRTSIYQSFMR